MPELWALHVEGPDSVIPMASKEEAEAKAKELNDGYEEYAKTASPNAPRWHGVVIPWPHSAEDHAEALAERTDDYC
jgi:hypothetical protein